jgi:hypothetical protein
MAKVKPLVLLLVQKQKSDFLVQKPTDEPADHWKLKKTKAGQLVQKINMNI